MYLYVVLASGASALLISHLMIHGNNYVDTVYVAAVAGAQLGARQTLKDTIQPGNLSAQPTGPRKKTEKV